VLACEVIQGGVGSGIYFSLLFHRIARMPRERAMASCDGMMLSEAGVAERMAEGLCLQ
jgi:hypothetical protein